MADVHSKETRSYNMSRIKSKNTKPEMLVRQFLHKNGFRYRLHVKDLPGKPDIVLPKYKTVIFIHGCFWHGHEGCKYASIPKTRSEWWERKITGNRNSDLNNISKLEACGWRSLEIYTCNLRIKLIDDTFKKMLCDILLKS
jgi:DNA mismatch endonuclease (patch repair protein)